MPLRPLVLSLAIATLTGCGSMSPPAKPAVAVRFEAQEKNAIGLVRVFDSGGDTVLQFADLQKSDPAFYIAEDPQPQEFKIIGEQLAVLHGSPKVIRVETTDASAYLLRDVTAVDKGAYSLIPETPASDALANGVPADETRTMRSIRR